MFEKDAKNYHVWSYRQWLVRHFGLWDDAEEWSECERWLRRDIRNNSAWHFRWFLVFARDAAVSEEDIQREEEFAKDAIGLAPQNESPWNYLRGVHKKAQKPLALLEEFARQFADLDEKEKVRSSHALDVLADIYAGEEGKEKEATKALDLLAQKYDPIRANYWNYRKRLLDKSKGTSAVA